MSRLKVISLLAIVLGLNVIAGCNDRTAEERYAVADAKVLQSLEPVCGRGTPVKQDDRYLCLYVNSDGAAVVRTILDAPVKGFM
jgi:hypothetical protein